MSGRSMESVFNRGIDGSNETVLLEQYKLYVKSANLTSRLRSESNRFFLGINTVLVGFVAGIIEFSGQIRTPVWIAFVGMAGVFLDLSWFFTIRSYRALNSGRFAVIHELETELPARVYTREWELIRGRKPTKRGYVLQTYVEQAVPVLFCLLYIVLAASYVVVN